MSETASFRTLTAIDCKRFFDFIIASDGSGAYCCADKEDLFASETYPSVSVFFIDFTSGKETKMRSGRFKKIHGQHYGMSSPVRFENRTPILSDETEFLCLMNERYSNIREKTVSVIDEVDTGFTHSEDKYSYIYRAKCGKYFFVRYDVFDAILVVSEILLNESDKLEMKTIARHKELIDPTWPYPFIEDDAVYYFSGDYREKMIKLSFNGWETSNFSLYYDLNAPLPSFFYDVPKYFNESICYLFHDDHEGTVEVYALNTTNLGWSKTISITSCYSHAAQHGRMDVLPDGSAFLALRFEKSGDVVSDFAKLYQIGFSVKYEDVASPKKLGKGSFGDVIKGIINGSQTVAVKILDDLSTETLNRKRRIMVSALSNARRLKELDHPNIIKGYGFIIEEDRFLLFMELMVESVQHKIMNTAEKRLEERIAFGILQQVLEGLVYLHNLKPAPVVHRDIKCANILLDKEGNAKLGDLGPFRELHLNTLANKDLSLTPDQKVDTRYWQAPEVLVGRSKYSTRADVWSIGCSFVEMVTGKPPYCDSLSQSDWARKLVSGRLAYNPSKLVTEPSKEVVDFLEKCFRKETKKPTWTRTKENQLIRPHASELLAQVVAINQH